jgi:hypothetical protein
MDSETRNALLTEYRSGYQAVLAALEGMGDADLDRRPEADDWTPREIVHHLADSEMTSAIRLRRLLAEDHPVILAYDEKLYARRLHYDRPIDSSLAALRAARLSTAALLDCLTEDEWLREGTHSENGQYGVGDWLTIYARHAHDHAIQIRRTKSLTS